MGKAWAQTSNEMRGSCHNPEILLCMSKLTTTNTVVKYASTAIVLSFRRKENNICVSISFEFENCHFKFFRISSAAQLSWHWVTARTQLWHCRSLLKTIPFLYQLSHVSQPSTKSYGILKLAIRSKTVKKLTHFLSINKFHWWTELKWTQFKCFSIKQSEKQHKFVIIEKTEPLFYVRQISVKKHITFHLLQNLFRTDACPQRRPLAAPNIVSLLSQNALIPRNGNQKFESTADFDAQDRKRQNDEVCPR